MQGEALLGPLTARSKVGELHRRVWMGLWWAREPGSAVLRAQTGAQVFSKALHPLSSALLKFEVFCFGVWRAKFP